MKWLLATLGALVAYVVLRRQGAIGATPIDSALDSVLGSDGPSSGIPDSSSPTDDIHYTGEPLPTPGPPPPGYSGIGPYPGSTGWAQWNTPQPTPGSTPGSSAPLPIRDAPRGSGAPIITSMPTHGAMPAPPPTPGSTPGSSAPIHYTGDPLPTPAPPPPGYSGIGPYKGGTGWTQWK